MQSSRRDSHARQSDLAQGDCVYTQLHNGKLTEKALEAKLDNKQKIRKAKLRQLTNKINVIEPMSQDFSNAEYVSQQMSCL